MAGITPILIGNVPGDNLGDGARVGAQKINANFVWVAANIKIKISGYWVDKNTNLDLEAFEVGDTFDGWVSTTRYVVGRVIALPFDVDDATKVSLAIDNQI
jgi:alpha-D-ribose 1-methylphosphonate 5-triphosphate synthase subunit PhnL